MAKKCNSCGFAHNPDQAHFCGKCGQNIAADEERWLLYDASKYRLLASWEELLYRSYQEQSRLSRRRRIWLLVREGFSVHASFFRGIGYLLAICVVVVVAPWLRPLLDGSWWDLSLFVVGCVAICLGLAIQAFFAFRDE